MASARPPSGPRDGMGVPTLPAVPSAQPSPNPRSRQGSSSRRTASQPAAISTSSGFDEPDNDDDEGAENPFDVPKEDVLLIRERERREKRIQRDAMKSMKIWEKSTRPSAQLPAAARSLPIHQRGVELGAPKQERIFRGRRQEKENMAEFLAKKRDMFLIQMSLDTKKQEIQMLEEKAQMKEDALKKSELMLEEDAMRFDAFLKDNDRKAHEAMQRADRETKRKQEKVAEIKRLNQEISKVENDMSKYEEKLTACLKYKEFLDKLTPPEYLADLKAKKEERQRLRRERKERERRANANADTSSTATGGSALTSRGEEKDGLTSGGRGGRSRGNAATAPGTATGAAASSTSSANAAAVAAAAAAAGDSDDDDGGGDDDSDDDNEPMYFQRPDQLLEIFAQLEERNLFLIQHVQMTEESLEELRKKYEETEADMEAKTTQLQSDIGGLETKIRIEQDKAAALNKRTRANTLVSNQQRLLDALQEKVRSVYRDCGFDDADTQNETLEMLRGLEQWLEFLLDALRSLPPKAVEEAEKIKEGERRDKVRKAKKEEQKREYEERLAKSSARAKAEVVKNTGKPVMFRSPPLRKKVAAVETRNIEDEEEEDRKKHFNP